MNELFQEFLAAVPGTMQSFVSDLDEYLTEKGCKCEIKSAKSGFVTSYTRPGSNLKLFNYVFRKTGIKVRIYAANVKQYESFLDSLPEKMKKDIKKATDCKKLNGQPCTPNCKGGYTFSMDGEEYKKCRNMAFMPTLNGENSAYIRQMIEQEVQFD